jgi:DNA transposition AAA+ family ATPase
VPRKKIITELKIRRYADECYGMVTVIAEKIGVSHQAVSKFLAARPELALLLEASRDRVKDKVERAFIDNAVKKGNVTAQIFF